jgi:hypothetical protein
MVSLAREDLAAIVLPLATPAGWRMIHRGEDGATYQHRSGMTLILSAAVEEDGKRWAHLSIAHPHRLPTWAELVAARDAFFGPEAACVQVLAPKSKHVNIHAYCLHLWRCLDGDPLPDFTRGTGSI